MVYVRQTAVVTHFDQLGRLRLERRLESVVTRGATDAALAADETAGIKIRTRHAVEAGRNLTLVSNPYREAAPSDGVPTTGWTLTARDTMDRVISVKSFAGAAAPAPWGTNPNSTGEATTGYNANEITVTDQAGKVRKTYSDAAGRLASVIEDPSDRNYLTSYLFGRAGQSDRRLPGREL